MLQLGRLLLLAIFIASGVYAEEPSAEASPVEEEITQDTAPNPGNLQPEWWKFFDVPSEKLEQRRKLFLDKEQELFSGLDEDEDTRNTLERLLKEISTHMEALVALKKQEPEMPDLGWIPKKNYTLNDYIQINDKVRHLDREIDATEADQQRVSQFISELKQLANNNFASYIDMKASTTKKYIQGIEQIAQIVRIKYLEEQSRLLKQNLEIQNAIFDRYKAEAKVVTKNLDISEESQELDKQLQEASQTYDQHHKVMLSLQQTTVPLYSIAPESQESWRTRNRELTRNLVQDVLLTTRIQFIKAKQALYEIVQHPQKFNFKEAIGPIQYFTYSAQKQMRAWERTVSIDFETLGHRSRSGENEKVDSKEYETQLRMALETMSYLDDLSLEIYHINLILSLIDQQVLATQSFWDRIIVHLSNSTAWIQGLLGDWMYHAIFTVSGVPITILGILKALTIFIVILLLSMVCRKSITRVFRNQGRLDETTIYTFDRVFHYTLLAAGALIALMYLGIDLRNVSLILGALGVGIGFGLQNIVSNFFYGLAILFGRNVRIGDYVELESGHIGTIVEVNVQTTSIRTFDGLDIMVPNSSVVGTRLINWTKSDPFVRFHIPFITSYESDDAFVQRVAIDAAYKVPITVGKLEGKVAPEVWLVKFGDNGLEYELIVWANVRGIAGRNSVRASYMAEVQRALRENNLHIPFPQRDLHIKTLPAGGFAVKKENSED